MVTGPNVIHCVTDFPPSYLLSRPCHRHSLVSKRLPQQTSMSRMNLTDNLESSKQKGLSASQFHKPRHILDLEAIHQPHKPSIEIVFVHGLGGESRGTWTDGQDSVCNFWPAWLPTVPGLENARILCFGYDSDWKKLWKPQTTLGIPQFGTSLLGALQLDNEKEVRNPYYSR